MNQIELTHDGCIRHNGIRIENNPLLFLGLPVVLIQPYSLRSFFGMLKTYPELRGLNPYSEACLEQFEGCARQGCVCDGIDFLELGKTVEMTGFPGEPGLEIYRTFTGMGSKGAVDIQPYGLEVLLDIPLQLGRLKHIVFGDRVDTFEFQTVYNLFELVDGISWALSFHNMPLACRIRME